MSIVSLAVRRRPHPFQCGEDRTFSASSAAFFSATAFLACPNQDELHHCRARRGPTPTQISGGPKRSKILPLAIVGALNAHSNLVRAMGPECRCAVRNAAAARVGGVRAACGV